MREIIDVDGYNIFDMKAKNWHFFHGTRKISKKLANEMINKGVKGVKAKWRGNL